MSLKACFHSVRFWQYFSFVFLATIFADTFSELYKQVGLAHGITDELLSWAGSASAVSNTVARLVMGASTTRSA